MKFRISLLYCVLMVCCIASVNPEEIKSILAVPNIQAVDVPLTLSYTCRNLVETALIKTGRFSVLSYQDIEAILAAQAFSMSGCTDESCAIEVGKLLAAEMIVVGELAGLGQKMILTLRLINVTTGKGVGADVIMIDSVEELSEKTFAAAYKLVGLRYVPEVAAAAPAAAGQRAEYGSIYVKGPGGKVLEVYLDGNLQGNTPLLIDDIPFGTHTLEARQGDYVYQNEIEIASKAVMEITADIAALKGNLFLEVVPASAMGEYTLFVDGAAVTPGLIRDIPIGEREITVTGERWIYSGNVQIESNKTTKERIVLTEAGKCTMWSQQDADMVLSNNQGQEIRIESGVAEVIPAGKWTLRITHPDYESHEQEITISQGYNNPLFFFMEYTEEYLLKAELAKMMEERNAAIIMRGKRTRQSITFGVIALLTGAAVGVCEGLLPSMITDFQTAYAAYQAAIDPTEALACWTEVDGFNTNIETARIIRTASLATSAVTGLVSILLCTNRPSTEELDLRIQEIEEKLDEIR